MLHSIFYEVIFINEADKANIVICIHAQNRVEHSYYVENKMKLSKLKPVHKGLLRLTDLKTFPTIKWSYFNRKKDSNRISFWLLFCYNMFPNSTKNEKKPRVTISS